MKLVSHDNVQEDNSETKPILSQPHIVQCCMEPSTSYEMETIRTECPFIDDADVDGKEEGYNLLVPEQRQCRICLDSGGEDLIAPCLCRGTQKYVHRTCLDNWRSTKEGFAFSHCTECRATFVLRANVPTDRWWLRLKFQMLVARDHVAIFIAVQLIVLSLGLLVYKFYGKKLRKLFGYEDHPFAFYMIAVFSMLLVGMLYGFFLAIIFGQQINERHYHVLARQELTKEYVVEDYQDSKNFPKLDPAHVNELKMLGLY